MRKKRSITLLEIVIVTVLLGFLLTGLFNVFYQAMQKNMESRALKQTVLQLELFEQRVKHLLTQTKKVWTAHPSDGKGEALCIQFNSEVDIEWDRASEINGMFYLNGDKQLCFASWSTSGKSRVDILLDKVDQFKLKFFDPKKKLWQLDWPSKTEDLPSMITIDLTWKEKEIPFTFFPSNPREQISYRGAP